MTNGGGEHEKNRVTGGNTKRHHSSVKAGRKQASGDTKLGSKKPIKTTRQQ